MFLFLEKGGPGYSRTRLFSKCTLLRVRQKLTRQPQKKLRKRRCPQRNRPWKPRTPVSYTHLQDLWDKPLLLSHQRGGSGALFRWLKRDASQLNVVATYNLVYNASLLVDEGLGYALTLDKLIHTEGTDMCFRPLSPGMEATAAIVWKKYQVFTKAADTFLRCLKEQLPQES